MLAELITLTLHHCRAITRVTSDAEGALAALSGWRPQLAIVDMDLVDDAFMDELVGPERAVRIPVIGLTRRDDLQAKLTAFGRGVDDILAVPFAPEELVARVMALLRRAYLAGALVVPVLHLGGLELNILNRSVHVDGHELRLTSREQGLLYLLAANAGRVVTRDEILDHVWGDDFVAESNVVDRHVRSLRSKLQDDWRRPRFIATVRGRGYRFVPTAD